MSKKLFSKASIVVALMGMGLFIANPIKADEGASWWNEGVKGMCGDDIKGYYKCEDQDRLYTPEASSNQKESGEDDSPVSQVLEWLLSGIFSWLNSIFSSID
ncbi:TPA: hypothetical protein VJW12_000085 [Streptococcus pyogenes]|uniref:hypothetical protein n=2 Tax=Streptococcus pyogenes TaxID=1314 RepID=UPI00109C79AD|nr:hypothetical protein [Streptococcus pyogenes]VGV69613.1 Uncharacterised protein [Streptococcus pyogenes]VGV88124.1 Uncharacterised protein [Streptococcus pyogenes]VHF98982.1 Uncharacterised protein [Streptococcus pyogenes]VHH49244.1 Uncharacterised protein [Streptococcus pyogenes]VHH50074.1 Uncharacterised protein [Streptococcus pyogenes]